jgi:hypothetical protein
MADRGQFVTLKRGDRGSPTLTETVYPISQVGYSLTDGSLGSFKKGFKGDGDWSLADGQAIGNAGLIVGCGYSSSLVSVEEDDRASSVWVGSASGSDPR